MACMHGRVRTAHRRMGAQQGVGGLEGAEGTGVRHAGSHEGTRRHKSSKRSECRRKGAGNSVQTQEQGARRAGSMRAQEPGARRTEDTRAQGKQQLTSRETL